MTGFGKAEVVGDDMTVGVEISSVNGRFLDLKAKMPRYLNEFEPAIRKMAQKYISRGRVLATVNIDRSNGKSDDIEIDYTIAGKYIEVAKDLSTRFGIENSIDTRSLLTLPDVISRKDSELDTERLWEMVREALDKALAAHGEMREREGETTGIDMTGRVNTIGSIVSEIEVLAPDAVSANTTRLKTKIEKLLGSDHFDENRFTMEIALYADRVDITEEIVRLKSHCSQFADEMKAKKTSGKRLSFLLQEMNREANTIASKSNNAGISQKVVIIKEELEKLREQADNLE